MRTIIELPAEQVEALDALCKRDGLSRAEVIRRAVGGHLAQQHGADARRAFGLWRGRGLDGRKYQDARRREWDR